jgi:hypothetical protein
MSDLEFEHATCSVSVVTGDGRRYVGAVHKHGSKRVDLTVSSDDDV